MEENVEVKIENNIAAIFLNEPGSLNALSSSLKEALYKALLEVDNDSNIKVAIIIGRGRAFCAGGDLKSMGGTESPIEIKGKMDTTVQIIKAIREIKKPIIAAVHGYAAGAGFSLALASDLIVAEEGTKFGLSFKNAGLIPDLGSHFFLAKAVGLWKAKEWIWNGKMVTAEQGEKHGFVNYLVPRGEGYERALQLAEELAQGPVQAYAMTKSILNQYNTLDLDAVLELENYAQSMLRGTEDHKEGIQAFREKRSPRFIGK